ncbi:GNAT family N-acetyltransferase [Jeotgalibacillus aurantiacus]|uniref:GNAT family N-acetyltransferase n=1 Tax=Jeotgalibacillus aurantiacus TaxID=2763266 RepID=UPI001D0B24CE|nr:GNAT family N-acetyltransferase [Jeotgalibacillus aurantiacus]
MTSVSIRHLKASDFERVSPVINEWWGGRQMADMLPRLFFVHFNETSFIAEDNGEVIGFLCGFLSQSHSKEAYIHFVGVHPDYRRHQVGRLLYESFFEVTQKVGRTAIKAVTSPVNERSIAFHRKMGFSIQEGPDQVGEILVFPDYDGNGQDRVLFVNQLK